MTIRMANVSDVEQMLDIYTPYVLNTPISFELEPPSHAEFLSRLLEITAKYPWLVFEEANQIQGYAYASAFKSRCAYAWSTESSIYVRQGFQGRGIGKDLYAHLLQILKMQGVVNVIGGMAIPNDASLKLHEYFGFEKVAHFKDVGYKLGKWWDVGYWQLQLQRPLQPQVLASPLLGQRELKKATIMNQADPLLKTDRWRRASNWVQPPQGS